MPVSGLDIITRALRLITVVGPSDQVSASEAQDALTSLNSMIDRWHLSPLTMYHEGRVVYPLVANTATYTIGTGGVFNQVRPIDIKRAGLILDPGATPPTEIPIHVFTPQEWASIPNKTLGNTMAQGIYYDHNFLAGMGLIWAHPVPSVATHSLVLYTMTPIAKIADLSTGLLLAQGYEDAFVYNLAKRLAPEYGKQLDPQVREEAVKSLAEVKRSNIRPEELILDPATPGAHGGGHGGMASPGAEQHGGWAQPGWLQ